MRNIVPYTLIVVLLLTNSTIIYAFPTSWWVNGNGYTGYLNYKINPLTNKIKGKLLNTPVEGYIIGRHIVLHRYPHGKRQIWEGWIIDRKLGAKIPSYKQDYFIAGTISVDGNTIYPWFGVEKGKTGGIPGIQNSPVLPSDISGKWRWFDGGTISIFKNGTINSSNGVTAIWTTKWNGSKYIYTINWNNGQYIDTLTLNGDVLDGKNQNGTHVWGKRIKKTNTIKNPQIQNTTSLPFFEDFSNGISLWILPVGASTNNEKIIWNAGTDFKFLKLKTAVPMENFVIEFDGYAESNGIGVHITDKNNIGYTYILGGWFNTKSGTDIGGDTKNRQLVNGKVFIPKKWQHYKIVRNGNILEAFCDGHLIFKRKSTKHFKGYGYLKFDSWNAVIGVDNIRIMRAN